MVQPLRTAVRPAVRQMLSTLSTIRRKSAASLLAGSEYKHIQFLTFGRRKVRVQESRRCKGRQGSSRRLVHELQWRVVVCFRYFGYISTFCTAAIKRQESAKNSKIEEPVCCDTNRPKKKIPSLPSFSWRSRSCTNIRDKDSST